MKKAMKKIIVASVALVAALGLATGTTFAWFSINNQVSVSGMAVKTQVSSNLFVAEGTSLATPAVAAESAFGNSYSNTSLKGVLMPVSTVNGYTFFYTTDAKADGSKQNDTSAVAYTAYDATAAATDTTTYANKFSEDYKVTKSAVSGFTGSDGAALAYIDYVIQLKAVNTQSSSQNINLTKLELKYTPTASNETDNNHAYRVAVFAHKVTSRSGSFATAFTGDGDKLALQSVYTKNDATDYFNSTAVSSATAKTAVTTLNTATQLSVSANATEYYKVVIRLYLEGEDTTCNNDTFLALTGSWALTVDFEFATGTPVTKLTIN